MSFFSRLMWLWVFFFTCLVGFAGCGEDVGEEDVIIGEESVIEEPLRIASVWDNDTCLDLYVWSRFAPLPADGRQAWANKECCVKSTDCGRYPYPQSPTSGQMCDLANKRCFQPCIAARGGLRPSLASYCGGEMNMSPAWTCPETGIDPDVCVLQGIDCNQDFEEHLYWIICPYGMR